jgi:DNA (cytosine-5)-methyltransferase 1
MAYTGTRYNVQYKLLNAADYGVPQTRERVVIVGIRADMGVDWRFPAETHGEDRLLWDMYVTGDYWRRHGLKPRVESVSGNGPKEIAERLRRRYGMFDPALLPWQTVRDALGDLPDPATSHNLADHQYRPGARTYPGHTGSDIDWPAKTIKAGGHGVPGGENMIRYEDGRVRYFTVFEAKRIQAFPDDFLVSGAWGEAMRQIGNAVPVRLASVLGKRLMETLAQPVAVQRKLLAG